MKIAHQSRYRYATRCEHKSIHVHWDNMTLSWQYRDFLRFGSAIRSKVETDSVPEPSVMIRINGIVVGWTTEDFIEFADMIIEAMDYLNSFNTLKNGQKQVQNYRLNIGDNFSLN